MDIMKLVWITLVFFLVPLPVLASYPTNVDLFQVSNGSEREDNQVVYGNLILYSDGNNSSGFDIYKYNVRTKVTSPVLLKPGQQFLNDYDGKNVLYTEYEGDLDPANPYDVRVYDTRSGEDILVAGGPGTQMGGEIEDGKVVYLDGYGAGDLYVYDLRKKTSQFIDHNASVPRMSNGRVTWYSGTDIKLYDLRRGNFVDIPNPEGAARSTPQIYKNSLIYYYEKSGVASIHLYDLNKGTEKTLLETTAYTVNWPSVSRQYAVWSKETAPGVGGVEGLNLRTGEVFEVYPQGNQQNSIMPPTIDNDLVAFMSWRTGNGDIYGALLRHRIPPHTTPFGLEY